MRVSKQGLNQLGPPPKVPTGQGYVIFKRRPKTRNLKAYLEIAARKEKEWELTNLMFMSKGQARNRRQPSLPKFNLPD